MDALSVMSSAVHVEAERRATQLTVPIQAHPGASRKFGAFTLLGGASGGDRIWCRCVWHRVEWTRCVIGVRLVHAGVPPRTTASAACSTAANSKCSGNGLFWDLSSGPIGPIA